MQNNIKLEKDQGKFYTLKGGTIRKAMGEGVGNFLLVRFFSYTIWFGGLFLAFTLYRNLFSGIFALHEFFPHSARTLTSEIIVKKNNISESF